MWSVAKKYNNICLAFLKRPNLSPCCFSPAPYILYIMQNIFQSIQQCRTSVTVFPTFSHSSWLTFISVQHKNQSVEKWNWLDLGNSISNMIMFVKDTLSLCNIMFVKDALSLCGNTIDSAFMYSWEAHNVSYESWLQNSIILTSYIVQQTCQPLTFCCYATLLKFISYINSLSIFNDFNRWL